MFQAAREGDEDFLRQALNAGLPVELMNEKGPFLGLPYVNTYSARRH